MKKITYKNLVFSFVLLLFFMLSCNTSSLKNKDTNFSIKDTSKIVKIKIQKTNDSLILYKKGNIWTVNHKYRVEKDAIKRLLMSLNMISMNTPLPENSFADIRSKLRESVQVGVWGKDKLLEKFYLGKYIPKSGNYFMFCSDTIPYIAFIPGHDFDLRANFSLSEKKWETTTLFFYLPKNIKEIYYKDYLTGNKFCIERINGNYFISPDSLSKKVKISNNEKLDFYLSLFKDVHFINFFENTPQSVKDSLLACEPEFEISLKLADKNKIELRAYPFYLRGKKDRNKFIGIVNKKDIILAKYYDFDLLRQKYSYFIK